MHNTYSKKPNAALVVLTIVAMIIVASVMVFLATGGKAEWQQDFKEQNMKPTQEITETMSSELGTRITDHVIESGERLEDHLDRSSSSFYGEGD